MRWSLGLLSALVLSCVDHQENEPTDTLAVHAIVAADAWDTVVASDDPLDRHRPVDVECDGVVVENGVLEIDTSRCPYFAARQGTQLDLKDGDWLTITIYHDDLFSEPPASGHLALLLDGELLWEATVPIPSEARLFSEHVQLTRDYPRNTRVDFHLHNHGLNHWRLVSLERSSGP